jgi:N6-adenosine-specific RNA methylase IME4
MNRRDADPGINQHTAAGNHGQRYRTIVADPPWPIKWKLSGDAPNRLGKRYPRLKTGLGYSTMALADIEALPVADLAAPDAHLFLWIADRFLIDGAAARIVAAWGFKRPRLFVWQKTNFGLGTFPRQQHESCVVAVRGSLPFAVRNVGSVQTWPAVYEAGTKQVRKKHSAKPPAFLDLVERVSPGPYLELFARDRRIGWDVWGNEVDSDVELAV